MSFTINSHEKTNRVQVVNIKGEDLDRLIFPFQKHSITSLEYKPFSRFTLAKSLDEVFENKLSKKLFEITKNINFAELCITSYAKIEKTEVNEVTVETIKAEGKKCPVCWKINKDGCERHPT